ncbi:MAG: hypothetical protein L0226_07995 [Acidobacteria bacterium]|nr:hypothetical protein [Acidobacteriota bacterium]
MINEETTGQAVIPAPVSMGRTAAACIAALILPGLGHLVLGKWVRGIIIGLVIATMFVLGFVMEGHLYKPESNEWLTWFFSFLDAGIGLPYLVCLLADWGIQVQPEQAAKVTFEYGNTFLCVAGALNMLAAMDAFDIGVGRKA